MRLNKEAIQSECSRALLKSKSSSRIKAKIETMWSREFVGVYDGRRLNKYAIALLSLALNLCLRMLSKSGFSRVWRECNNCALILPETSFQILNNDVSQCIVGLQLPRPRPYRWIAGWYESDACEVQGSRLRDYGRYRCMEYWYSLGTACTHARPWTIKNCNLS